jgi:hypothetical protein
MIRNILALVFGCCVVHLVYNGILKLDLLWSWICRNLKIGNRKKRKAHPVGQNQHRGPNFMPRSAHFSPSLFIFLHDTARWGPFVGLPGTAVSATRPSQTRAHGHVHWPTLGPHYPAPRPSEHALPYHCLAGPASQVWHPPCVYARDRITDSVVVAQPL